MATRTPLAAVLVAVLATLAFPEVGAATTIIPFTDGELVDRAPVIVQGVVEGPVDNFSDVGVTRWLVGVEGVLKGTVLDGAIVVTVPGGLTAAGEVVFVPGSPKFQPGDHVLLFLEPSMEDEWKLFQFVQGAFVARSAGGRVAAVREYSDVATLGAESTEESQPGKLRDFRLFGFWIASRVEGSWTAPSYTFRADAQEVQALTDEYTLLPDFFCNTGLRTRWFEFDSKGSVRWKNSGTFQWLPSTGADEFFAAQAAWNAEPTTPVNLKYDGSATATKGAFGLDGKTTIMFNDPFSELDDIDQSLCKGTLAVGVPKSRSCTKGTFNGEKFVRLEEADIVINNGLECVFQGNPRASEAAEELFAHELGHTLGIGHSSTNEFESNSALKDALMYYTLHGDGRGARLTSQDVAALQALYKKGAAGTPGCPANTLCLLNKRFQVTVSWSNQFDGSSGVGGPLRSTDLSGFFYFTDPSNIELMVKVLDFGNEIKIFYSQLTNLRFTMTVLDTYSGRSKTYSNTPGDCGAIDPNFLSSALLDLSDAEQVPDMDNAVAGSCRPSQYYLCLQNNRFEVWVSWRSQYDGAQGYGTAKKLSDLTGAFSFTDPANLELLIKTLDFGNKQLVLWGALSNLEYQITVTDTVTGKQKQYYNAPGRYCGGLDENF